jgi:hypothetical protein
MSHCVSHSAAPACDKALWSETGTIMHAHLRRNYSVSKSEAEVPRCIKSDPGKKRLDRCARLPEGTLGEHRKIFDFHGLQKRDRMCDKRRATGVFILLPVIRHAECSCVLFCAPCSACSCTPLSVATCRPKRLNALQHVTLLVGVGQACMMDAG